MRHAVGREPDRLRHPLPARHADLAAAVDRLYRHLGDTAFVPLREAVIGAIAGYLFLWCVYWLFRLVRGVEGMGYGDFKLLGALGAWLGWQALPQVVLVSAVAGAIFGIGGNGYRQDAV